MNPDTIAEGIIEAVVFLVIAGVVLWVIVLACCAAGAMIWGIGAGIVKVLNEIEDEIVVSSRELRDQVIAWWGH